MTPKTDQHFFKFLPSEITLDILSRLPPKTIMKCKCVCKPWLDLLETPEFVKFHLSKSVLGLATFELESAMHSMPLQIAEFVDELDLKCDDHHLNILFNLELPFCKPMHSSINGLMLLGGKRYGGIFLCNPITRDYITLPCPQRPSVERVYLVETYGFGVSRMSEQYKVVRFSFEFKLSLPMGFKLDHFDFECQVYTVGTGLWRRIECDSELTYERYVIGAFLNGNLHWLALEGSSRRISCLDLETELFTTFLPPPPSPDDRYRDTNLSVLGDCLCVCESSNHVQGSDFEIHIWLMKEYGDGKSWTKEFIIRDVDLNDCVGKIWPIKVFKDGDILMEWERSILLYYSSKIGTIRKVVASELDYHISCRRTIYAPSFVALKTFAAENVSSF